MSQLFARMSSSSTPVILSANEWKPDAIRYMQPKVNDRGGKSINIISSQTSRGLHVSTPLMMTWGISDYVDEKTGESDGKYSMSLNFPNTDFATAATTEFLEKVTAFEKQILEDAVKNSEAWFGEEMTLPVVKHTFFPCLKYSKDKVTKKVDPTKPPSIRVKVPNYGGRWAIEIYDPNQRPLFPCENANMTPMDFIPKKSTVACVIQCGGLWFGGKGWGLTWKLVQCVVKPQEVVSVYGRCHIQLSPADISSMGVSATAPEAEDDEEVAQGSKQAVTSTEVEDSDEEAEATEPPAPEPSPPVSEPVVKKIIKKASVPSASVPSVPSVPPPSVEPVQEQVASEGDAAVVKKKIIKKKPAV